MADRPVLAREVAHYRAGQVLVGYQVKEAADLVRHQAHRLHDVGGRPVDRVDPGLNATGIGGSFYGQMGDFCIQGCFDWYEYGDFVFSGYWSNGWHSAFSAGYTWDFYFATNGGLGITTQTTPEPSSIALLGSGVLGLIGYGRKRLGR